MNYVINEKREICKIENIIASGISDYKCILCKQKVIFVKESVKNKAHFRHYKNNKNVECEFYKKNFTEQDKIYFKNIIKNKMSEFHINWQNIFPKNNIEIKIYDDILQTYKRADIYIESIKINIKDDLGDYIFLDKFNSLVIEIQNSFISENEIIEREYFYKNKNRQLLWIFNLKNTSYIIEKLSFYCKSIYRIKIKGGYNSFMNLLNKKIIYNNKPNIILDPGNNYLYVIKHDYENNCQFIEFSLMKRSYFLKQLINLDKKEDKEGKFKIDYEINYIAEINKLNKINFMNNIKYIYNIHKCFYIIENLQFKYFYDNIYNYFINEGFIIVGEILSKLSDKNPIIMKLWIDWIEKNIPHFQDKITFGKYKGERLYMIDRNYIIWLYINSEIYDEDLEHKISLLAKMYDKEYLKSKFMNPKYNYSIGTLIFMYRKINNFDNWLPPYIKSNVYN